MENNASHIGFNQALVWVKIIDVRPVVTLFSDIGSEDVI